MDRSLAFFSLISLMSCGKRDMDVKMPAAIPMYSVLVITSLVKKTNAVGDSDSVVGMGNNSNRKGKLCRARIFYFVQV
jgi:hypothetical protein